MSCMSVRGGEQKILSFFFPFIFDMRHSRKRRKTDVCCCAVACVACVLNAWSTYRCSELRWTLRCSWLHDLCRSFTTNEAEERREGSAELDLMSDRSLPVPELR